MDVKITIKMLLSVEEKIHFRFKLSRFIEIVVRVSGTNTYVSDTGTKPKDNACQ